MLLDYTKNDPLEGSHLTCSHCNCISIRYFVNTVIQYGYEMMRRFCVLSNPILNGSPYSVDMFYLVETAKRGLTAAELRPFHQQLEIDGQAMILLSQQIRVSLYFWPAMTAFDALGKCIKDHGRFSINQHKKTILFLSNHPQWTVQKHLLWVSTWTNSQQTQHHFVVTLLVGKEVVQNHPLQPWSHSEVRDKIHLSRTWLIWPCVKTLIALANF